MATKRSPVETLMHQLASQGVGPTKALRAVQEAGLGYRRTRFLKDFARISGRPQRADVAADRALARILERAKGIPNFQIGPERRQELRQIERAKYTPKKYAPPEWSFVKKPFTFADGARYSYRFEISGSETVNGRRRHFSRRYVSLVTNDRFESIAAAEEAMLRFLRSSHGSSGSSSLVVREIHYDSAIVSTK